MSGHRAFSRSHSPKSNGRRSDRYAHRHVSRRNPSARTRICKSDDAPSVSGSQTGEIGNSRQAHTQSTAVSMTHRIRSGCILLNTMKKKGKRNEN